MRAGSGYHESARGDEDGGVEDRGVGCEATESVGRWSQVPEVRGGVAVG